MTDLGLSGFDTSKVTSMEGMFAGCCELENLDLSSFDTSNVWNMKTMFEGCKNLKTIYAGEGWSTSKVKDSEDMFVDCTCLVGGKGTKYDSEFVDATRAKIDGGKDEPGYFTTKK